MTQEIDTETDGKAAYLKAQKQRSLYIGLALGAFVILVFFVTMSRMASNTKHEAELRAAASSSR